MKDGAAALEEKLVEIEGSLHQLRITGGQDGMRWPGKLTVKIPHLFTELQGSDFAPTSRPQSRRIDPCAARPRTAPRGRG